MLFVLLFSYRTLASTWQNADNMPNSVFVWDNIRLRLAAVLVQLSPVKSLVSMCSAITDEYGFKSTSIYIDLFFYLLSISFLLLLIKCGGLDIIV